MLHLHLMMCYKEEKNCRECGKIFGYWRNWRNPKDDMYRKSILSLWKTFWILEKLKKTTRAEHSEVAQFVENILDLEETEDTPEKMTCTGICWTRFECFEKKQRCTRENIMWIKPWTCQFCGKCFCNYRRFKRPSSSCLEIWVW